MDALEMLRQRRSVRKFKDELVSREVMREVIETTRFAPSWANTQIARYTLVDNVEILAKIAEEGVKGFVYNQRTIKEARHIAVLSYVTGKSGQLADKVAGDKSERHEQWETFDCGISCQTFCLAAYEKGIGTCIFGVIDESIIAQIIDLPENEKVAALIVYGYFEKEVKAPKRLEIDEVVRFL